MKLKDKWRIVAMPDYEAYFPDMSEPAYILFDGEGGGEFAFGCVTDSIYEAGGTNAVVFSSGTAMTKWTKPRVTAGPSFNLTARSKAKPASTAATKLIS